MSGKPLIKAPFPRLCLLFSKETWNQGREFRMIPTHSYIKCTLDVYIYRTNCLYVQNSQSQYKGGFQRVARLFWVVARAQVSMIFWSLDMRDFLLQCQCKRFLAPFYHPPCISLIAQKSESTSLLNKPCALRCDSTVAQTSWCLMLKIRVVQISNLKSEQ